jgi:hypothetical protein
MASITSASFSKEEYFNRVSKLLNLYWSRSNLASKRYRWIKVATATLSAIIPVIANVHYYVSIAGAEVDGSNVVVTVAGVIVSVLLIMEDVWKFKERHISYGKRAVSLEAEREKYKYRAGDYAKLDDESDFLLFVERVENSFSSDALALLEAVTKSGNESQPQANR